MEWYVICIMGREKINFAKNLKNDMIQLKTKG